MNSDLKLFRLQFSRRRITAAAALLAFGAASSAYAEGPDSLGQNRCAGLGGDFVAVSGARGCVRIGGHVRAEPAHAKPDPTAYPTGFGLIPDGVRHASETFHVRAGAPAGGSDIVPR